MKKYFVFVAFLICNFSLYAQVQPDTIKTIDPYDEIVWETNVPGQVWDILYHPNGRFVFTLNDGVVQMYDVANAFLVREFGRGWGMEPVLMALSNDGSILAVSSHKYDPIKLNIGKIILFNTNTGEEIKSLIDTVSFNAPQRYNSVCFSPDDKNIVATGDYFDFDNDFSYLKIFNIETGNFKNIDLSLYQSSNPNFPKKGYQKFTNAVYSPDGKSIFASTSNYCIVSKYDSVDFKRQSIILDQGFEPNSIYNKYILRNNISKKYILIESENFISFYDLETDKFRNDIKIISTNLEKNKSDEKGAFFYKNLNIYDFKNDKISYIYKYQDIYGKRLSRDDSMIFTFNINKPTGSIISLLKAKWDAPTSVEDLHQNDNFNIIKISPNPAKNFININLISNLSNFAKIEIISVTGQSFEVTEKNVSEGINNIYLPVSDFSNGNYILKLTIKGISKQINFIINR